MSNHLKSSSSPIYHSQWQAYRKRRNLIAILICLEFLAFIPFLIFVATIERRFFSSDIIFFPAMLVWGALYLFTASWLRSFRCPRCNKNFFGGFFATPRTMLARSCAHCGLARYEGEQLNLRHRADRLWKSCQALPRKISCNPCVFSAKFFVEFA
jgi:hypothetical protein